MFLRQDRPKRRRAGKKAAQVGSRPGLEALEARCLLSGPDWVTSGPVSYDRPYGEPPDDGLYSFFTVRLGGLEGTVADQVAAAQRRLDDAGLTGVTVLRSSGSAGTFVIQTAADVTAGAMNAALSRVPGYQYLRRAEGNVQTGQLTRLYKGRPQVNPLLKAISYRLDAGPLGPPGDGGPLGPPPTLLGNFDGLDAGDNPFTVSPPDTIVAAGPDHVVEAVNVTLRVYDKAGDALLTQTLADFFAPVAPADPFDPLVTYDTTAGRWIIGAASFNQFGGADFLYAVSNDSNPLHGFAEMHKVEFGGAFFDFPKLGFNADSVVFTGNLFNSPGTPIQIIAVDKSSLLDANPGTVSEFFTQRFNFRAMVPATMHGSAPGSDVMYFVEEASYGDGSAVRVVKMTDVLTPSPVYTEYDIDVDDYGFPPLAQQPGGLVATNDTTFLNADWRNGRLVAAHTVGSITDSDAHVAWYLFDAPDSEFATPSLMQEGRLDPGDGISTYFGGVAITDTGTIGMTYMQSSPTEYVSMYVTGRSLGDPAGTMRTPLLVAAGEDFLDGFFRAGDYSGITVDPADGSTFWAANEYKAAGAFWSTAIAHFSLGLSVTSSVPAAGSTVAAPPTQFTLNFSEPIVTDTASIDLAGFTVNGQVANSYTVVDQDTLVFTYLTSPVVAQGLQSMALAAGSVVSLADGTPVQAYSASFRYDALPMQVVSIVPAAGSTVTLPLTSIVVNLNEPYAPSSVSAADLSLSMGSVVGFQLIDADSIRFLVSGLTSEGVLALSLAAGALTDVFGNPSLPYSAILTLDYGTVPFQTPTTPVGPPGGLIYETSATGLIAPAGDTDSFTILVDPGQTISVVVEALDGSLRPVVQLFKVEGTDQIVGTAAATAAGGSAVIQAVSVPAQLTGPAAPKLYKVTVGGLIGTTGRYRVRLILNSAVESENYGGSVNDTRPAAQSLEASFVQLGTANPRAERGAVLGQVRGGARPGEALVGNRSFNFFGGEVYRYDTAGNRVQTIDHPILDSGVISDVELGPDNTVYVALSTSFSGPTVQGMLVRFDLAGNLLGTIPLPDDSNVGYLYPYGFDVAPDGSVWVPQLNSGFLVHVSPAGLELGRYFVGSLPLDAAVRPDGRVLVSQGNAAQVVLVDPASGTVAPFAFDPNFNPVMLNNAPGGGMWLGDFFGPSLFDAFGNLTQFIPNFGTIDPQHDPSGNVWTTNFASGLVQRFSSAGVQQFAAPTPGGSPLGVAVLGVDSSTSLPPVDLSDTYSFTMSAGGTATIVLDILRGSPVRLELLDSAGTLLAIGGATGEHAQVISQFIASAAGTYYLRVSGSGTEYSLVVTRNAEFDTGGNDSFATAQDILSPESGGQRRALGHVSASKQVVLDAIDSGWWDSSGSHDAGNDNYVAGLVFGPEYRNYVAFDLSGVSGTVSGATLRLSSPSGGYVSPDPSETYTLFDVTTPIPALTSTGSGRTDIFADLGTGTTYGSRAISQADDGTTVSIPLNAAALAALSAAGGGRFALGGAVTSLGGASLELVFGFSGNPLDTRQLVLTVVDTDFYRVSAQANDWIEIETQLPASGPGEFVNNLDPLVRLYDAAGRLVASDDNGAPDGRNARLRYRIPAGGSGTYYIEVGAAGASRGEYVLLVKNVQPPPAAPFRVDSTVPPDGAVLYTPPQQVTASFNDQFLATTVQGSDLRVDGVPGSAASLVDGRTATFATPYVYQYNGHYYLLTSSAKDWASAEAEARAMGGHLVTINDQAEQDFLKRTLLSGSRRSEIYWIGLNDIASEGTFVWSSGEPVSYLNWGPGEPNDFPPGEDAAVINWYSDFAHGAWNDYFTDQQVFGIIELTSRPAGSWVASEGTHAVSIPAGAIRDLQGTPVSAYSGQFTLDYTAPRVVGSSIRQGDILPAGDLTYVVTFSEPINTLLVDGSDFGLVGQLRGTSYSPTGLSFDATGTVLTVRYSGLLDDLYTLVLYSNPSSFVDRVGLMLDGEPAPGTTVPSGDGIEGGDFFVSFATDAGPQALPTPLVAVDPLGSLVYRTPSDTIGAITFAGDTDDFTINLDAGQTVTVLVNTLSPGLQGRIMVFDPDSMPVGSTAFAPAPGQEAVFQATAIHGPGTYLIRVSSAAGPGLYAVSLIVNAAVEAESHGGPRNDDLASAQPLDPYAIDLGGGTTRAAVLGRSDGSGGYAASPVPFGFVDISATGNPTLQGTDDSAAFLDLSGFGFSFPFFGQSYSSLFYSTNGLITFGAPNGAFSNTDFTTFPNEAAIAVLWDDLETFSNSGAVYWQVLGSSDDQQLVLQWNDVGYYAFTGGTITFQAILGEDGSIRFNYLDLEDVNSFRNEGASATVGVKDAGPQGPNRLVVSLDSGPNAFVGSLRSTLIQPQDATSDFYSVDLAAGQSLTVALADLVSTGVQVEILDAGGNVVASGVQGDNLVANGSFETGDFTGWTTLTTGPPFIDWTVSGAGSGSGFDMAPTSPQDGSFVAWNSFDGGGPMQYVMYQDVTLPAGSSPVLTWQDRVQWNFALTGSATQARIYQVRIVDPSTSSILETPYSFSTGTDLILGDTGWQSHTSDLSAYAGQTIRLLFLEDVPESFTGPAQIEFDAIRISTGGPGLPTNVDAYIPGFVAPADGTYYIRVFGDVVHDYNLVAVVDGAFDAESNDTISTAQALDLSGGSAAVLGHVGQGASQSLTFDELPFQSVDGLTFQGVTFDYKVGGFDSFDAYYGAFGPGTTTYTSDPGLEGGTGGVLTLDFAQPANSLEFGLALSIFGDFADGATVRLFDASSSEIGTFAVSFSSGAFFFTSGFFSYSGTPVARAQISFNSAIASRFVLDNLRYASAAGADVFAVVVGPGQTLSLSTATPAGGPGEFVNNLDPRLRVLDADGNVLYEDDNGAPDGRNALLSGLALAPGTYYVEVSAVGGTLGEYVLHATTASAFRASGFGFAASSPGARPPADPPASDSSVEPRPQGSSTTSSTTSSSSSTGGSTPSPRAVDRVLEHYGATGVVEPPADSIAGLLLAKRRRTQPSAAPRIF